MWDHTRGMSQKDPMSRLSAAIGAWLSPLFLLCVAISVYEVGMRYLFNAPTVWVHETTVLLSAVAFIVSGLYALERREHIRITVLSDRLPGWMRPLLRLLNLSLAVVFLGAVAWGGFELGWQALSNWQTTQSAFNSPTPAILKPLLVVTAALMIVQVVVQFLRDRDG